MTLFRKKANPKLELTGMDPMLQRSFVASCFLVVSSGAPELRVVSVWLGPVCWLTGKSVYALDNVDLF